MQDSQEDSEGKKQIWRRSWGHKYHSHDVRTIEIADNLVLSAGVDTKIVVARQKRKQGTNAKVMLCSLLLKGKSALLHQFSFITKTYLIFRFITFFNNFVNFRLRPFYNHSHKLRYAQSQRKLERFCSREAPKLIFGKWPKLLITTQKVFLIFSI